MSQNLNQSVSTVGTDGAHEAAASQNQTGKQQKQFKSRRGKRSGAEIQKRKDNIFGNVMQDDSINYKLSPSDKLDMLLEQAELSLVQKAQTDRIDNLTGLNKEIITTDWSNHGLFESAVSMYDVIQETITNVHKYCDIVEYIAYCQLVVEGRLTMQTDMAGNFQVSERLSQEPGYLLNACLHPMTVKFLEVLSPTFTKEGTLLKYAPYEYVQAADPEHNEAGGQLNADYRLGHGRVELEAARWYNCRNGEYSDDGMDAGTIRHNIYDLILYRNQKIQQHQRALLAHEMNEILGFDFFTHNYMINPQLYLYCPLGLPRRYGTHLHEFAVIGQAISRFSKGKFRLVVNFSSNRWTPIKQVHETVHFIDEEDGAVHITTVGNKFSELFTPNVIINTEENRAAALVRAAALGSIPYNGYNRLAIVTASNRIQSMIYGLSKHKLADVLLEWQSQAGLVSG